jgi:hypothetical protein
VALREGGEGVFCKRRVAWIALIVS